MLLSLVSAGLLALFAIGKYNSLVNLRNRYKNAFAQLDVQLRRRYDLIPNLVERAAACVKDKREILETIISTREFAYATGAKAAANPGNSKLIRELSRAEAELSLALERLFAETKAYPELGTDETMLRLWQELRSANSSISVARQTYNDAVIAYNKQRQVLPANILAYLSGFAAAELLTVQSLGETATGRVSFT
jgi:LemA protein